ncbi:DGQHR domain-containing protein [Photobacterium damselae]|uniref:DGQHR domain-containing protein n=1 Tax=Photobacterium damselae TaxID=38293 RepID=UPI00406892A8
MMYKDPIPAIKIQQPLGVFYVFKMKASDLNELTFSSRAKYKKSGFLNNNFDLLEGNQRNLDEERSKDIARFINSVESALPNSIILGANFKEDGTLVEKKKQWYVEETNDGLCYLNIPVNEKLAAIIDGQHRLSGCVISERKDIELLCAVYLDLPVPYHAYLFANINANQKKVPKSLAYELYGFGTEDEDKNIWSPEKLAVSLVRKLNFSERSNLKGKVILGAQISDENKGFISLASLVDSIMKLITKDPKKDRDNILYYRNKKGRKTLVTDESIPLRQCYIDNNDDVIEDTVFEFINYIFDKKRYNDESYLFKTIGVESLFMFLRDCIKLDSGVNMEKIKSRVDKLWDVDFTDDFFTASGIGKSRVYNTILVATGLKNIQKIKKQKDQLKISELLRSY